jgi:hypothetical protein
VIILLSPSKAMDFASPVPEMEVSTPLFLEEARPLVEQLRPMSVPELRSLFGVSDKVAALNQQRFQAWTVDDHEVSARPALYAYAGPVYTGLAAQEFSREDREFARRRLRIISGLYGVLRPSDAVLPYRLDMGTKLDNPRGKNLYAYWSDRVTELLARELAEQSTEDQSPDAGTPAETQGRPSDAGTPADTAGQASDVATPAESDGRRERGLVVNLASKEYSSVLDWNRIPARIVECRFKDRKGDRYRQIQYYVKRARGLMAHFIVKNRIRSLEGLRSFDLEGYRYSPEESDADALVFLRDHPE